MVGASAVALALLLGACSDSTEGTETGGAGEGSEGSEGGGQGEAAEGGTGQGEAAEGGVVNLLAPGDTYDETINGARLILNFDAAANEFVGSVENTTNGPLTRARVEIHLSNGTELGPTTPTDLTPGQTLPLNLASTTASFDTWSAHPEVGAAEAGGDGAEGAEGSGGEGSGEGAEGGSGEGPEGTEGGGQAAGSTTTLTSTGISRGPHASQTLAVGDGYAGKLNDLEVAVLFDAASDTFIGRVKNEANEGLCNTRIAVNLDGRRTAPETVRIPALDLRGRADFVLDAGSESFTEWTVETDTFTCTSVVNDSGEGSGESAGGESGSEGSGAESAQESAPPIPVSDPATGTFNNLDYAVAYDPSIAAFRGVVTNNTNQIVCGSRLEIHMAVAGNVIELGPTIDRDLAPGEALDLVLSADPVTPETYSLHPESSPCP